MEKGMRAAAIAMVVTVAVEAVLLAVAIWTFSTGRDGQAVTKVNGQPLDAHEIAEYDRPAWLPDCVRCWKVTDRSSGKKFWLLQFKDGSYVTEEIWG